MFALNESQMKKQILKKLKQINKVAELTGMEGKVTLEFSGCSVQEWDDTIDSISEYPRYRHFVSVTPKLTVILMLV